MGQMEAPSSQKTVKLEFLGKPDAEHPKLIICYRAIALTWVMWKWYGSCVILRLEKEKELESWQTLHVGGIGGISCQHLQVMMTILKHKTWEC